MIKAKVEVTKFKRIVDPKTMVARAETRREPSLDFDVECSGPASDALSMCRAAFAEKYQVPIEGVRASFAARKQLDLIHLIYQV